MDSISACAYGIKVDSIDNPDHPIVSNVNKFFGLDAPFRVMISILAPKIAQFFKVEFFDMSAVKYFSELTNQIVSERKKINIQSKGDKGIKTCA